MAEEESPKCLECGSTSDQAVLLTCLKDNEQKWVCVRCLPILIHGGH